MVGNGVFDMLVTDLTDPETGIVYPALSCKNDPEMAEKYQGQELNPPKVIYSIKANATFNSDCAVRLKDNLKRGKLRLLANEQEAEKTLYGIKGFRSLSSEKKTELLLPFTQTTLTINEIINLKYDIAGGNKVKLSEKGNDRKDRYSSLAYANYIASELELDITKKKKDTINNNFGLYYRKPVLRKR